jgi:SAM-dependent methyltransferase
MKPSLVDELFCPACLREDDSRVASLDLKVSEDDGETVQEGLLSCGCGSQYPIMKGIPRMLPDAMDDEFQEKWKRTQNSFGRQWNAYDVQSPEEDRHLFHTKTGFDLDSLSGLRVLDAGCGGGRYAFQTGRSGAEVFAVDISHAVEKTAELCRDLPNVHIIQANLMELPFRRENFDRIYSIGVMHHTPDTRAVFEAVLPFLRPGGLISIWLYKQWSPYREFMNNFWRGITTRMPHTLLHACALASSPIGGVKGWAYRSNWKLLARAFWQLEKFLPGISNHPEHRQRVCDTFDWFAPQHQWHHTDEEVSAWLEEAGLEDIVNLSEDAAFYVEGQGEGVNFQGKRRGITNDERSSKSE